MQETRPPSSLLFWEADLVCLAPCACGKDFKIQPEGNPEPCVFECAGARRGSQATLLASELSASGRTCRLCNTSDPDPQDCSGSSLPPSLGSSSVSPQAQAPVAFQAAGQVEMVLCQTNAKRTGLDSPNGGGLHGTGSLSNVAF